MTTRADIVAEARRWLGTPFHHQASLQGVGCDCIGLIAGVAAALGMPEAEAWRQDVRYTGYGPLPLPDKLLAACRDYLDAVPVPDAIAGDILLFTMRADPMHFGLLSCVDGRRYVIHAWSPNGKVVEQGIDEKWQRRIVGAYRYRGIA